MYRPTDGGSRPIRTKVFCFFFSKKMLPCLTTRENIPGKYWPGMRCNASLVRHSHRRKSRFDLGPPSGRGHRNGPSAQCARHDHRRGYFGASQRFVQIVTGRKTAWEVGNDHSERRGFGAGSITTG